MDEVHQAPDSTGFPLLSCGVDTSTSTTPNPYSDGGGAISPARYSCRIIGGGDATYPCDNYSDWASDPAARWGYITALPSIARDHWYDLVWRISWSAPPAGR